jgi:hypothetical protein
MTAQRFCYFVLLLMLESLLFRPFCLAQGNLTDCKQQGPQIRRCKELTQVVIELQGAPPKDLAKVNETAPNKGSAPNNSMEPKAEPARFRVDDRTTVQFLLRNLSPLDVCSLNGRTPTPTAETNVAESLAGTIAKLAPLVISGQTPQPISLSMKEAVQKDFELFKAPPKEAALSKVQTDAEYHRIQDVQRMFFCVAFHLIDNSDLGEDCREYYPAEMKSSAKGLKDQLDLAREIQNAATDTLANFAGTDYRGKSYKQFEQFDPISPDLQKVVTAYEQPLPSIEAAGKLQAWVDEMGTWALDLHKKYDFKVPAADDGSNAPAPSVPQIRGTPVVSAAPATLSFDYSVEGRNPPAQMVGVSAGGTEATFAVSNSGVDWLQLKPVCPAGVACTCTTAAPCTTPTTGTFNIAVTADPGGLKAGMTRDDTAFTISGIAPAVGTTIVNVSLKPAPRPSDADIEDLRKVDEIVDRAKSIMSLLSDNNKMLEGLQSGLNTSYLAIKKVYLDYVRRKDQKIIDVDETVPVKDGEPVTTLVQKFNLGTDRKATVTGNVSCVSDIDGKTPTTDSINFSILYQNVPKWTASVGLLTSFLERNTIGVVNEATAGSSTPMATPFFQVTDRARAQLVPMAYVNYRLPFYKSQFIGTGKEDELIWTGHLSAGFGVNSNSGTNQPEFFLGFAIGLNRFMIHPGVHFGRTQSLGGGYNLNTQAPSSVTTAPIIWSYHPAFSIGFSVRLAPY